MAEKLIHNNRDRLIYQFDLMGDRAYYLELKAKSRIIPISSIPTPMSRKALFSRR